MLVICIIFFVYLDVPLTIYKFFLDVFQRWTPPHSSGWFRHWLWSKFQVLHDY